VTAVHVDHGLRPGSAREAEVVAEAARRFGAAFRAERVRIAPGPNLEARARAARREVLPRDAATGHTADDQAETILLNMLRGAGADGLAGMRPGPRHPILALRRSETAAVCAGLGLEPVVDPTNADPRHLRNRVRHEVLPLLEAVTGRDLVPVLARQAELLADEAAFLDGLAADLDPLDAKGLAEAPAVLARRAVRRFLRGLLGMPPPARAVGAVLAVARGEARAAQVVGGLRVRRRRGRLGLDAEGPVRDPGGQAGFGAGPG
jgi:tRNA(Ile)-lysidine synthase